MKRTNENIVSSYMYYMWNRWSRKECERVFKHNPRHFWEKWEATAQTDLRGAAERFYAELSTGNRQLLVNRACELYNGQANRNEQHNLITEMKGHNLHNPMSLADMDENTLYREMVKCLPKLYFPLLWSDDALQQLADTEFDRVRSILCRSHRFDEDEYVCKGDGTSPFDLVRDDLVQEVFSRIRKDTALLQVNDIREKLIGQICKAIKEANGCIGTFYTNKGKHHTDCDTEEEYEDSPIVVVHDSDISFYGNYEAATLYDLFLKGDNDVYCTLNGESGEDFDLPVDKVQTEGLINIVQWLKEHDFLPSMEKPKWVCEECGSSNIQTQAWVRPNEDDAFVDYMGMDYRENNWCDECEEHPGLVTLEEWEEEHPDEKNCNNQ